jgi:hypothetical protein
MLHAGVAGRLMQRKERIDRAGAAPAPVAGCDRLAPARPMVR